MKKAEGKYISVRAITREEAVALAPEIFEVGEEVKRLWAERDRFWIEGDRLQAEIHRLQAEIDKLWAELAIKLRGYIPESRAMNFIAADLDEAVYSFVWPHSEIWVYDGEKCPNRDTVEKLEWRIKNEEG